MKQKHHTILITLIILTVAFIWGNSILPADLSLTLSEDVRDVLVGIPETTTAGTDANSWLSPDRMRKLAHAAEFCLLGAETALFAALLKKMDIAHLPSVALFGLSVAVIDETIQLFNGRSSMVPDIWIDFAGFAAGVLAILTAARLVRRGSGAGRSKHIFL